MPLLQISREKVSFLRKEGVDIVIAICYNYYYKKGKTVYGKRD